MGGLNAGHYVTYAVNHGTGKWYSFNDTQCEEIDSSKLVTNSAYILFYRRNPSSRAVPALDLDDPTMVQSPPEMPVSSISPLATSQAEQMELDRQMALQLNEVCCDVVAQCFSITAIQTRSWWCTPQQTW